MAIRAYRLHFTARLLSWTGSAVSPIALAFAVLDIGGGTGALGLVLAASVVPQVLLLLVGGVVADRLSRARVMVRSNIVCAVAEALAVMLLRSGDARVWHLVLMSGICGAAGAFFTPAAGGIVKDVVPAELRHAANALLKIGQNLVKVGGPALGGVLVAAFGSAWAIGWDAVTFAVAAVLFARIDLKPGPVKVKTGFLAELREGWADFRSRRWLWVMVVQGALVVPVWLVGYQLLGPVYGARYLGGAGLWGLVVSAFTGGLVAGAAVALMWRPRLVGRVVCAGTGSLALPLAAMACAAPLLVLLAATAAAGTGLAVSMTVWSGLVQERIPADRLSRALSYSTLGQLAPVPVAYLIAGPVSRAVGVRATLAAGALVIVLAAVLPLLVRQVRALAMAAGQPAHGPVPTDTAGATARAPR